MDNNTVIDHRNTLWYVYRISAQDAVIEIERDMHQAPSGEHPIDAPPTDDQKLE